MQLEKDKYLLREIEGSGLAATKGDRVVFNSRIFLNQGDEVSINEAVAKNLPVDMIRVEQGRIFIDHIITLGKRQTIAAVESSLIGMRAGGYRKVRVSPHLAYREEGIPGLIPGNAVLVIEIWLRRILSRDGGL